MNGEMLAKTRGCAMVCAASRASASRRLLVLSAGLLGLASVTGAALAHNTETKESVRYLRFDEVRETILRNADSGLPGSDIRDASAWNRWIREEDREIRARVDRGVEDSISNLILYGTSFTDLPRIQGSEAAITTSGELTAESTARIAALETAIRKPNANERVRFVGEFLKRKGIGLDSGAYLSANLRRFAVEQAAYQENLQQAAAAPDPTAVYQVRGDLYERRGLSVDTSLLPNFALEETLRAMLTKGAVAPASMQRIAIVGPGLDFADKRDGYDFYPLQTLQPFAVLEAVQRLGLAKPPGAGVMCFDLNVLVIDHIERLAAGGRTGKSYTIQLPRDERAGWSEQAVSYWRNFGELLGSPAKALPAPTALASVDSRAVRIRPQFAAELNAKDLNIVAQTEDLAPGSRFDLVVATNVLVYYNRLQQAIAIANIARMMKAGGIFLANSVLPAQHTSDLEYLGRRTTLFAADGSYGDDVVVYRRR